MQKIARCLILILMAAGAFLPWCVNYQQAVYVKSFVWNYSIFLLYVPAMLLIIYGIIRKKRWAMVMGALAAAASSMIFFFSLPYLLKIGTFDLMTSFTHSGLGVYFTFLGSLLFISQHQSFI